ncbi:TetR/AcrR family transcriptional regulator [Nocardia cyriacigeorgica]|uniref:TetR/AcrR family transcriptional regulator n=1 Tax=Nocardia cyriacigeorgica TaxID=135487 RepID=UPI0015B7667D|nr:TetR/AcrR family transcriptional regulator [Nocardia cyriacigeorgica]
MDAAFIVFSREGYYRAGVDAIAARAQVAKHTIYNHFGDKEALFRELVANLSEQALTRNLAAVEILDRSGDLTMQLTETALRLAECYCDERSVALRRLLQAHMPTMPDLLDIVKGKASDRVGDALTARLAKLALTGRLNLVGEPATAAEHFGALLTAPLEARTRMGTRRISDAELHEVAENAVATFLRAFGDEA